MIVKKPEAIIDEDRALLQSVDLVKLLYLIAVGFLFLMLSTKFGNTFLPSSLPSFPENIFFGAFPGYFLTLILSIYCLFAFLIFKPKKIARNHLAIIITWLLLTIVAATFGYYEHDVLNYAYYINQLVSVILILILTATLLSTLPESRYFIIFGLICGFMYTILNGIDQYFWGFDMNIAYFKEMQEKGVVFPQAHVSRIMQKLVFSNFTISNSFAAHIILLAPLISYFILKSTNATKMYISYSIGSSLLLFATTAIFWSNSYPLIAICLIIGLILILGDKFQINLEENGFLKLLSFAIIIAIVGVLFLTKSRAGFISLATGLLFAGIIVFKGKVRINCIILLICGIVAAFFITPKIGSFKVRLGYYKALVNMVKEEPSGKGFGAFSEYYNRTKGPGIEESNTPHSFFFGFLGHAGYLAALMVVAVFVMTLLAVRKIECDQWLKFSIIAGFSSWFFHAQVDFNFMIPGTIAIASSLPLLIPNEVKKENKETPSRSYTPLFYLVSLVCLVIFLATSHHSATQIKYTQFHTMLNDIEYSPSIEQVKSEMVALAEKMPYTSAPYDEAASWAERQLQKNKFKQSSIQLFAYINLAEEALNNAILRNPKKSSFYTRLAIIYFESQNYEMTQKMLKKSFELYPHNDAAFSIEHAILMEWMRRDPQNNDLKLQYIKNRTAVIRNSLGLMRFSDHLNIPNNELNKMYLAIQNEAGKIKNDLEILKNLIVEDKINSFMIEINTIVSEAKKIVDER